MIPDAREQPTLTAREVAPLLRISLSTTYAGIKDGTIPSIRIGGRVVVPTAALQRLLCLEEPTNVPNGATANATNAGPITRPGAANTAITNTSRDDNRRE
jgi:excisionase family DNA binding protein